MQVALYMCVKCMMLQRMHEASSARLPAWLPLQFDAPQEPDAFVHRCGRTARMGRRGSALAFLLPHETSYADFLRLRRVRGSRLHPHEPVAHAYALLWTSKHAAHSWLLLWKRSDCNGFALC